MAPKSGPRNCPQCGAYAPAGQKFCGGCGRVLNFCVMCGATNLAWFGFCHNCGNQLAKGPPAPPPVQQTAKVTQPVPPTIQDHIEGILDAILGTQPAPTPPRGTRIFSPPPLSDADRKETRDKLVLKYLENHGGEISIKQASNQLGISELALIESLNRLSARGSISREHPLPIERMRICGFCKKVIGEGERFCSYCGRTQAIVRVEPQASLDPHTMKVTLAMLSRVTEAKDHPEYSAIDQLTTLIAEVALGKEKPHDAQALSFSDQLRLLTLVFEYTRDKVSYKGEAFGEYVRWPWETVKTGGDCDCKVVLLATMLASLAFRRMHLLILPAGAYTDMKHGGDKRVQGHVILEAELFDNGRAVPVRMDPSCADCDVDDVSESMKSFLASFYRIPVIP